MSLKAKPLGLSLPWASQKSRTLNMSVSLRWGDPPFCPFWGSHPHQLGRSETSSSLPRNLHTEAFGSFGPDGIAMKPMRGPLAKRVSFSGGCWVSERGTKAKPLGFSMKGRVVVFLI